MYFVLYSHLFVYNSILIFLALFNPLLVPLYNFGVKKTLPASECDSPEYYCCLSQIRFVGDFDTRSFKSLKLKDDNLILLLQQRAGQIE